MDSKMKSRHRCGSRERLGEGLRLWFAETPGRNLLEQEYDCLDGYLSELFGHYLLQVGCFGIRTESLQNSRIRSRIVLLTDDGPRPEKNRLYGDSLCMPIASDSVDVVLLSHTLDFSPDPHRLLREVERVLIPGGRVLILGFNPWSLWGLWKLFRLQSRDVPWCGRFLSQRRLADWLALLGFEVERRESLMYRPPLKQSSLLGRLDFMEKAGSRFWPKLGGVYLLQAVKQVSVLTPVKPGWKLRTGRLGGRVAEPSTRV
jgi:SAM-dependent methyltransferase